MSLSSTPTGHLQPIYSTLVENRCLMMSQTIPDWQQLLRGTFNRGLPQGLHIQSMNSALFSYGQKSRTLIPVTVVYVKPKEEGNRLILAAVLGFQVAPTTSKAQLDFRLKILYSFYPKVIGSQNMGHNEISQGSHGILAKTCRPIQCIGLEALMGSLRQWLNRLRKPSAEFGSNCLRE